MTEHEGQSVSPYLLRPLRSFQQALAERNAQAALRRRLQLKRKPMAGASETAARSLTHAAPMSRVA